jgi:hypothetical protein
MKKNKIYFRCFLYKWKHAKDAHLNAYTATHYLCSKKKVFFSSYENCIKAKISFSNSTDFCLEKKVELHQNKFVSQLKLENVNKWLQHILKQFASKKVFEV